MYIYNLFFGAFFGMIEPSNKKKNATTSPGNCARAVGLVKDDEVPETCKKAVFQILVRNSLD